MAPVAPRIDSIQNPSAKAITAASSSTVNQGTASRVGSLPAVGLAESMDIVNHSSLLESRSVAGHLAGRA